MRVETRALLCAFFASASILLGQTASNPPAFTYEGATGPAHWGDLSPAYSACKTGKEQSPIDIRNAKSSQLPGLKFEYKPAPLRLINNGHTVQVNYPGGSFLTVDGEKYELKQFHFHHPSEERIDGRAYDMVIHMVHANSRGETAVVSVLVDKGPPDGSLQKIWATIPKTIGQEREIPGVTINAADLVPAIGEYFTYRGSLTTPPCSEGVTWFVLKTPITASANQIKVFKALFSPNARPIQPLGERIVTEGR